LNHAFEKALIIGSGEDIPTCSPPIDLSDTLVICADGGTKWAQKWNVIPNVVLGDMDSIDTNSRDFVSRNNVQFLTFSPEKDKTDVELAIDYALERGVVHITLTGTWGSRADHSLANVELLFSLMNQGFYGEMVTSKSRIITVQRNLELLVDTGCNVSLLPLSDSVGDVWTWGLYYPLKGATLQRGTTLGVSNKALASQIRVTTSSGHLLVIVETSPEQKR